MITAAASLFAKLMGNSDSSTQGKFGRLKNKVAGISKRRKHEQKSAEMPEKGSRRLVFVSVLGFYGSYRQCSQSELCDAMLILPIKKEWLYDSTGDGDVKENDEEQFPNFFTSMSLFFYDEQITRRFIQLLRFKHEQGLLFCMLDERDSHPHSDANPLVNPFWYHLSEALVRQGYDALHLDPNWYGKQTTLKFSKTSSVMCELYFRTAKYRCIQEIVYQSNPGLLKPIVHYDEMEPVHSVECQAEDEGSFHFVHPY